MAPKSQVSGNGINLFREGLMRERKKVTREKRVNMRKIKIGGNQAIEHMSKENNLSEGEGKENVCCGQTIKTCTIA